MNIENETIDKILAAAMADLTGILDHDKDELMDIVWNELIEKLKTAIIDAYWQFAYIQALRPHTESGTPPLDN